MKEHFRKHWKFWLVFVTAVAFATFVWPSMYQYQTTGDWITRVNRVTGDTRSTPDGPGYRLP